MIHIGSETSPCDAREADLEGLMVTFLMVTNATNWSNGQIEGGDHDASLHAGLRQ
jgi:hypothetical protein